MNSNSNDDPSELERELSAFTLVKPTPGYATRAEELLVAQQETRRKFWLPYAGLATAALVLVAAVIGLPKLWEERTAIDNQLVDNSSFSIPEVTTQLQRSYESGVHYQELEPPIPLEEMTEDEIRYYFSYHCNPCYQFEEILEEWYEPELDEFSFIRIPAIWSDEMRHYAQVFFLAEEFGVLDRAHGLIFESLHESGERLDDLPSLIRFFSRLGISQPRVIAMFNSEEMMERVRETEQSNRDYSVQSTPMLVVNRRYMVQPNQEVGQTQMLRIAEYLVENQ